MACVYAGASDLAEFWATVLTQRCGFREFPQRRLPLNEYGSPSRDERDKTYVRRAAFIDGFEFDWKARRVPKAAFEATDPVHWLALTTALQAIEDGGVDLDAVGRDRIGVILGNSLTGEVSRANLLRLRWPYVRRALAEGAARVGLGGAELAALVAETEQSFKNAFPVPNEDTLAGALSNVIAGRICNVLDLNGGGYVVDGACASSLLAASAACEALAAGRLDMVLAGGVDISLDPLEMVGFARTGAITTGSMRVYDQNASGFLPGEGCGMVVLMRGQQVARFGLKPWARIAGWGISSDGTGGITEPKAAGQALAMRRCYERSGFGADTLDFIEGHGTGTPVGDRQELLGFLESTRGASHPELRRTGVTSVKTLLGHTKAAAGAAGLIKAVLAVNQRVLPPLAGLEQPADAFATAEARIYPIARGRCLAPETGLRAGVSGAGFGGINCHIAITGEGVSRRGIAARDAQWLLASAQNAELFIASAADVAGLLARIEELLDLSAGMAEGELVDLAAACALRDGAATMRAAVVAASVAELRERLAALAAGLKTAKDELPPAPPGTLLGRANPRLRIGYLIPGQGSQFLGMGGKLARRAGWAATRRARWDARFAELGPEGLSGFIDRPLERAATPEVRSHWEAALRDTRIAQPAIVLTGLQWLQWLRQIGITPSALTGHSLGEITALVAAHLLSETEAIDIVRMRAQACAAEGESAGAMLALKCDADTAQALLAASTGYAVVANDNAPDQVVVAGEPQALAAVAERAAGQGIEAVALNVSNAFHSRYMTAAAEVLGRIAGGRGEERSAGVPIFSGVHGGPAPTQFDPFAYVAEQIAAPVRFREAVQALAAACDILVEVGPGSVLTGLARKTLGKDIPVCALEPAAEDNDAQFCTTLGQLFVAGAPLDWEAVYAERYFRPFVPASERKFIENPCALENELDPALIEAADRNLSRAGAVQTPAVPAIPAEASVEDIIRELIARETGYDLDMISPEARLARDLNLDSIKVAELRAELRSRGIDLPEDLAMGTTPIRAIARVAVRQPTAADGEHNATVPPGALPENLPVLGYVRGWRDAELVPVRAPLGRAVLLAGSGRTDDARHLGERLTAAGVQAWLDDGTQAVGAHGDWPVRLIALPGERTDADQVAGFFARFGAWIGTGTVRRLVESVVLISQPALAPVFGFAQSLSLEQPELPILAVEADSSVDLVPVALAQVDPGVRLLRVGADHACRRMALDSWQPPAESRIPLAPGDVVVISGGAKGITAECALALLQATGARALLLGTSPEHAPGAEADSILQRMAAAGLKAIYLQCDVADPAAVRAALQHGAVRLGTQAIAGLVHGAGVNTPTPATSIDPAVLRREYAIKVGGLANLLAAIDPEHLKLCMAFGSVIGTVGMHGNSGYALANEAMAAVLADLKRARPHLQVACPAYSVWSEVGMGAKLNVLDSLERQQVAAIPIDAGVRWFLECCGQPNVPLPLVIAAPMHGLPTWRQARGTDSDAGLPYVDDRVVHEPGVVLVSRPVLNPQRDDWLNDHNFRGSLLFATVEALAAIGAGARLLAGGGVVNRFVDLQIAHPIVVAQHGDTVIEIDVRSAETAAWSGRVGMPGAAWADPAFAVRCRLGTPEQNEAETVMSAESAAAWRAVPAEVGAHLYDSILFQGRLFQRIEALNALDLSDDIHRRGRFSVRRERAEPDAPVPDTFFLDALLQTVQVLVPKDLCLPIGIDEIIFHAAAWEAGMTTVEAEIIERTETGYVTRVQAWNAADGAAVARFEGYRVSIVERFATRPDAHALFDPVAADKAALAGWLAGHPELAELNVVLDAVDDTDPAARRAAAATQIAGQLGIASAALTWNADGAPVLTDRPGQDVAVAHDAGRLLTACGSRRVGCDLQRIGQLARPWDDLLPASRTALWRALTGAMNDRDQAGAIVWAIHEALIKAGVAAAGVTFVGMENGAPSFRLAGGGVIGAGVLDLVLAGPVAIAVVQPAAAVASRRVTHYTRDLEMTFKEALPPLKSPTASVFFAWMGELREEAMSTIRGELAHTFSDGGKGMVTNGTRVRIVRPLRFHTPLRAWVWLKRVLASQPSTFELGFQWAEMDATGVPQSIVAEGSQRLTWVDVGPAGHVTIEPFPPFFAEFIAERSPPPDTGPFTPPLGDLPESQDDEAVLWRHEPNATDEHGTARLWLETDETHSNFVGNIYFSHAATLVERACGIALRRMGSDSGGFFPTALELNHLGEAMPGDTLAAEVRLSQVGATSCCFDLTLLNQSHGNARIATGRARYRLYAANTAEAEPQAMPAWLMPNSAKVATL